MITFRTAVSRTPATAFHSAGSAPPGTTRARSASATRRRLRESAQVDVGRLGGLDADQDLASGGRGDGQIDDFDHLGRTEGFDLRCAHKAGSSQTAAGSWMPEASRPGTYLLTSKRAADGFARARGGRRDP